MSIDNNILMNKVFDMMSIIIIIYLQMQETLGDIKANRIIWTLAILIPSSLIYCVMIILFSFQPQLGMIIFHLLWILLKLIQIVLYSELECYIVCFYYSYKHSLFTGGFQQVELLSFS
jgi:hypothetical protein